MKRVTVLVIILTVLLGCSRQTETTERDVLPATPTPSAKKDIIAPEPVVKPVPAPTQAPKQVRKALLKVPANLSIAPHSQWGSPSYSVDEEKLVQQGKIAWVTICQTGVVVTTENQHMMLLGAEATHMGGNEWGDISYHYVIDLSGQVFAGRSEDYRPDTKAETMETEGVLWVAVLGDYKDPAQPLTMKTKGALIALLVDRLKRHQLKAANVNFHWAMGDSELTQWFLTEGKGEVRKRL